MSDTRRTILDYAGDEISAVLAADAEVDAIISEIARIREKREEADLACSRHKMQMFVPDRSRILAEHALAGTKAPPPPPMPSTESYEELKATRDGLTAMLEAAEARKVAATGRVRAGVIEVFKAGANRAAEDYARHAEALAEIHAIIGSGQFMLDSLGFKHDAQRLISSEFNDLAIPTSDFLPALKGKGKRHSYRGWLAGGHPEELRTAASGAFAVARNKITSLLGGRWPLGRF